MTKCCKKCGVSLQVACEFCSRCGCKEFIYPTKVEPIKNVPLAPVKSTRVKAETVKAETVKVETVKNPEKTAKKSKEVDNDIGMKAKDYIRIVATSFIPFIGGFMVGKYVAMTSIRKSSNIKSLVICAGIQVAEITGLLIGIGYYVDYYGVLF